jgi:hypothetical protein
LLPRQQIDAIKAQKKIGSQFCQKKFLSKIGRRKQTLERGHTKLYNTQTVSIISSPIPTATKKGFDVSSSP